MKVVNPATIAEVRSRCPTCEWCKRALCSDIHHYQTRGMGGGSRLDIAINLFGFCTIDHTAYHDGQLAVKMPQGPPGTIDRKTADRFILGIIARREKVTEAYILEEIGRINRLSKDAERCPNHGLGKFAGYPMNTNVGKVLECLDDGVWQPGMFYCPECERKKS